MLVIVGLWVIVYLLPDVLFHHLQWGAFMGSRESTTVALTFDDGPGDDTDAIIETLNQLQVKATFFVIVARAQAHPDVIGRMVASEHEVGLHMNRHVSAFLLWPWQSYREIRAALLQLESLTGKRPQLFRPPWGHVNLGTYFAIRKFRLTPVFWNIAPDDWKEDHSSNFITHYVVQLAQPGLVVVMHDAGGERERTRLALPSMVEGLRSLGLHPGRVKDIAPDRSNLRRIWTWWELRFTRSWDIDTIPNSRGGEAMLRLGRSRYRGTTATLDDGSILHRGDALGEIHFGNPALSQLSGDRAAGLRAMHGVMGGLGDTASYVKGMAKYQDVVAIGGVTLLDAARAIEKLGFRRYPVRGWMKWSMQVYLVILMSIYHKDGWGTLRRWAHLRPVMVLMSREEFLRRYGQEKAHRRRTKTDGGVANAD